MAQRLGRQATRTIRLLPIEVLAILALATYRAARIPTKDTISEPFREKLYQWAWDDEHPVRQGNDWVASPRAPWRTYVHELITCPLCFGVWTAALLYVLWRWSGSPAVQSAIVILALAGVQCFLASRQDA